MLGSEAIAVTVDVNPWCKTTFEEETSKEFEMLVRAQWATETSMWNANHTVSHLWWKLQELTGNDAEVKTITNKAQK